MRETRKMTFWDCNASFGRPCAGTIERCDSADDLLAEMEWVGVERALVWHALMRDQSPVVGNAVLAEAIRGRERLIGSWAILPPQTGELPAGEAFFEAMAQNGIKALWALPRLHRYRLTRSTFGGFLDAVSERRIPLLLRREVGGDDPGDSYDLVESLCSAYPELTVILTGSGSWGEDRLFRPLLELYPRLHIELCHYELDCGLRELVRRYGPARFLFGSDYPASAMGGAFMLVRGAELTWDERETVAAGNLKRLLGEVKL